MILSVASDTSKSFCVMVPLTELSRPMEEPFYPRLLVGRRVRGGSRGGGRDLTGDEGAGKKSRLSQGGYLCKEGGEAASL